MVSGTNYLGLLLLSMAWLFFLGGLVANYQVLRASLRAKAGERVPSSLGFIPGVVGSLAVFLSVPALAKYGLVVPWPWLWIVLPLFMDPYCAGGFLLLLYRKLRPRR